MIKAFFFISHYVTGSYATHTHTHTHTYTQRERERNPLKDPLRCLDLARNSDQLSSFGLQSSIIWLLPPQIENYTDIVSLKSARLRDGEGLQPRSRFVTQTLLLLSEFYQGHCKNSAKMNLAVVFVCSGEFTVYVWLQKRRIYRICWAAKQRIYRFCSAAKATNLQRMLDCKSVMRCLFAPQVCYFTATIFDAVKTGVLLNMSVQCVRRVSPNHCGTAKNLELPCGRFSYFDVGGSLLLLCLFFIVVNRYERVPCCQSLSSFSQSECRNYDSVRKN